MPQPAYVYARFSNQEQSRGDSLARQFKEGRAFVERMGWAYDASRNISDEGRSGFHGINRAEGGSLRAFEDRAQSGEFKSGVCLCVESVDRLTRRGYEDAVELLQMLTRSGVTVATWFDNQVYEADKRIDLGKVMALIIKAELAHEESSKKSKRLKSAWASKVGRAQDGERKAMTRIVPGWLEVDDNGVIQLNRHRTAVLNEVFDHYIEGRGLPWIVGLLNDRQEPNWGLGRHGGKGWNASTLHKYLTSRTVLGEYQPKHRAENGGTKVGLGFTIPDYYPQAVDAEKFNRVQHLRKQRTRWGGKNQLNLPNLFSGVATCRHCGGPLHLVGQSKPGVTRYSRNRDGTMRGYTEIKERSYLRCNNAIRRYGCANTKGVRYQTIEPAVLDALFLLAMKDEKVPTSSRASQLSREVEEQARLLDVKRRQLDQVIENLTAFFSRPLGEKAGQLEEEIEAGKNDLRVAQRQLTLELGNRPPELDMDELLSQRAALDSEDDENRYAARAKAHAALKGLIGAMTCDDQGETRVTVGDNAFRLHFNAQGECLGLDHGQGAVFTGPGGEIDWHPDYPDADYEIAAGA